MDNKPTRARRRPESVQNTRRSPQTQTRQTQPVRRTDAPQSRPVQNRPVSSGSRYTAGNSSRSQVQRSGTGNRQRSVVRRVNDLTLREDAARLEKAAAEARKEMVLRKKSQRWLAQYQEDVKIQAADAEVEKKWQNEVIRYKGGFDFWLVVFALLLLVAGTVTVFSAFALA